MTDNDMTDQNRQALSGYVLSLADTTLVLGQRLVEWTGHGPLLEEDIALSNLALDLIGQSRALYTHAGELEGLGRDEDTLAFLRNEKDYRNLLLVEQANGDFAMTMVRHLLYSMFAFEHWQALQASRDATLAAIAAKATKELAYHRRHSAEWVLRLGDGTDESHRRAWLAVDTLWAYTGEMFEVLPGEQPLIDSGLIVDPGLLQAAWLQQLTSLLTEATLGIPDSTHMHLGGRTGEHTENLGFILADMQHMQRSYPGLNW